MHAFQDHLLQKESLQDHSLHVIQDQSSKKQSFQDHSQQSVPILQDHCTTANVHDIIAINNSFTKSFDWVGNMPGTYTIHINPSIPPVQHARRKVPIEYKTQIEKALQHMEDLQIMTPVTAPTEWVSSITYQCKPDGTLCICLDPQDLNKAIIREHYKAPTLKEISHKLVGVTIFSKLDAKDGFWSIQIDTPSSYLTTFNRHKGRYRFLQIPFGLKMSQDVFW